MNPVRDHLVEALEWARQCTHDVLGGIPDEKATFQSAPSDNHVLWILGHIALSDEWILKMITGEQADVPAEWGTLFGYQSQVQADAGAYPPLPEVRDQFERSRQRLLDWLRAADDAQLDGALDDGGVDFAKSPREALQKEAWHEGWHAGQISTLRRAMGLSPAF
jgi:uncharacterized damage-inducible protein DinB